MLSRRFAILLGVLALPLVWIAWRAVVARKPRQVTLPMVEKRPVAFTLRTFDPAMPPAEMPPLGPGEEAECDSNFLSSADVGGEADQTDSTHAIVTVTRVKVTLQLNIAIWAPTDASQHVMEHEEGHRQISEYYYQNADKVAERIASTYIGKQVLITGGNLQAELSKSLQQMGAAITEEYGKELDSEAVQLRYDRITDHSRNDVRAQDAVAQAVEEASPPSAQPAGAGN